MKKILAIFLVLSLFLPVTVEAMVPVGSVEGLPTEYTSMANALTSLGIIEKIEFTADVYNSNVSRGKFAKYLLDLINMEAPEAAEMSFSDLPKTHTYFNALNYAGLTGLLSHQDGKIRPDGAITVGEASKAVVTLLGYAVRAEDKGGSEQAYLNEAKRLEIIGSGMAVNDKATMALTVQMLYNALITNEAGYSIPQDYSLKGGVPILESRYGLKREKGLVTANQYYALSGSPANENSIIINGNAYRVDEASDVNFVGLYVEYFYDSHNKIAAICPEKYNMLVISGDMIDGYNSNRYRYYNDKDKLTNASVAEDPYVIKNYKAVTPIKENMLPDYDDEAQDYVGEAEIVLIDYNDDNKYEIVFVNNYSEMVVDNVNAEYNTITCKGGKSINYGDESKAMVISDNKIVGINDIAKGSVISLCNYDNDSAFVIRLSQQRTEGTITEINEKTNEVYIRGKSYPISGGLDKNTPLKVGSSGLFYLNYNGKVVYFEAQSTDLKFGYLMNIAKTHSFSSEALFKILTADNEIKVFEAKDKINYNDVSTSESVVADTLLGIGEQLIRYAVNSKGEIYSIETPLSNADSLDANTERLHCSAQKTDAYNSFEALTTSGTNTVKFSVPENPGSDEIYYKAINTLQLSKNTNFKAYNMKKYDLTADAIVFYTPGGGRYSGNGGGAAGNIDYDGHPAIVTNVVTTSNSDGFEVKKATILQNTGWPLKVTEFSYIVADNSAWETNEGNEITSKGDNLNIGDVIMYSLNTAGEIGRINRLYNGATKTIDAEHGVTNLVTNNDGAFSSPLRLLESYAYKTEDNYIMVATEPITSSDISRDKLQVYDYQYENVILVENVKNEVKMRVGKISDIRTYENYGADCDKVLINTNWGTVRIVVAIRSSAY